MKDKKQEDIKNTGNSESFVKRFVSQIAGEPDHEFPHIVSVNGKIHCNNCGAWQWLAHWQLFLNKHDDCVSG